MQKIIDAIQDDSFIRLVLSPPKTAIRKIAGKKGVLYQLTETKGAQVFHKNLNAHELMEWVKSASYKQGQLFCEEADYHLFFPNKVIKNPPTSSLKQAEHNRQKRHVLSQAAPPPYFKALEIKRDKFLQIEKFLNEVKAILPAFKDKKTLHVVDFGCGKAYLTFALYDFLKEHFDLTLVGIDLKKEVMENCQQLADELGYTGLKFIHGAIDRSFAELLPWKKADLVVALHACDTATDEALEKAVQLEAQVILAAPCCQHQLYNLVKNDDLAPLLKHGILKERFAALATDALRGIRLETLGYEVKLVEFIDAAHTPKNILIRAVFTGHKKSPETLTHFNKLLGL